MTDTRFRTSLDRAPSLATAAEIAHRRKQFEGELFHRHRVLIIGRDAPDLKGLDRILFDRIANERFGKKGCAA